MGNKGKKIKKKVRERDEWNVEGNIIYVRKRMTTCVKNTAKKDIGQTKSNNYILVKLGCRLRRFRVAACKKKQFKLW